MLLGKNVREELELPTYLECVGDTLQELHSEQTTMQEMPPGPPKDLLRKGRIISQLMSPIKGNEGLETIPIICIFPFQSMGWSDAVICRVHVGQVAI